MTAPASSSASTTNATTTPTSEPPSAEEEPLHEPHQTLVAGTLTCEGKADTSYKCSTQVNAATTALLTLNDFSEGRDCGGPSECDEKSHPNTERVVALPTWWYNGGTQSGKMIRITTSNERSATTKVVDECNSRNGRDKEHAGLPPCRNNIVDGSAAVWIMRFRA